MGDPAPGTPLERLDTPALVVDLRVAEANIARMQEALAVHGKALRAHAKFHKSAWWAAKQLAAGASGVCTAKLGEAEALVAGGIEEILVANEVTGAIKIERLVALAARAKVTVAIDDPANAREISAAAAARGVTVGALVDVNVRLNRCGVEPGAPTAALARTIADLPGLRYEGLMGYEGHVRGDADERRAQTLAAMSRLETAVAAATAAGLPPRIVSAGGTSNYAIGATVPCVTELQCGSYLFMDSTYHGEVPEFPPALWVVASVMSRPAPDRAILDAGFKAISEQFGPPRLEGPPGATLLRLNAEHAIVQLEGEARALRVGDQVRLLPSKTETTINLHAEYFCLRDGVLEAVVPIDARGRFR
jgi:D-serine deaminase-like pyridoxal phosphate-dependent protein